jgi:hypothetical protein
MSHSFLSDPETAVVLRICQTSPGFVPVILRGRLFPVREINIADYPVSSDLSVEDFVLGLEVLGCRLVRDRVDDVAVREPAHFRSPAWAERARQIQAVMSDAWEGRRTALSDYLHDRDDLAERQAPDPSRR